MNRLLLAGVAVLAIAVAVLSAVLIVDSRGEAEANAGIDCSVQNDTPEAGQYTVTCSGGVTVDTPVGPKGITFTLIVVALDNPPDGPSFGDEILSCQLDTGTGLEPINIGPCP